MQSFVNPMHEHEKGRSKRPFFGLVFCLSQPLWGPSHSQVPQEPKQAVAKVVLS